MARILIKLSPNRTRYGELTVEDGHGQAICGPLAVSGRASDRPAQEHRNETRNSLLLYGDTPTGKYRVLGILRSGEGTSYSARQYGSNGLIVLDPVSGDAALADANGRFHIFIQGGATGRGRKLRSTNGCLRLLDGDQAQLVDSIRDLGVIGCDCIEDPTVGRSGTVVIDNSYNEGDPPAVLGSGGESGFIHQTEFSRRAVLRGVAVGAAAAAMQTISLGHTIFVARDGRRVAESVGFESVAMAYPPQSSEGAPEEPAPPAAEQAAPPAAEQSAPSSPPPVAPASEVPPSPAGPPGPEGPATQPFGTGSVPPEKAGLSPETNQPSGGPAPSGAAQQLENIQKNTENAPNAPSPEEQKQQSEFNTQGGASGAPAVNVPPASEPPTPRDTSDPQYQQLKGDYDKSKQEYQHAVDEENKASSDWDKARRDPNSVTKEEYNAAYQRAQKAESARRGAQYQAEQEKQKVTTYVLDKNKNSGQ